MTNEKAMSMCDEVSEEIARVVDGSAAQELYDHIAECDACRDLRHDASRATDWVKTAGADFRPAATGELGARILAALDARPEKAPVTERIGAASGAVPVASGTGSETASGTGSGSETGAGSEARAGSGSETGSGTETETGSGTETKAKAETAKVGETAKVAEAVPASGSASRAGAPKPAARAEGDKVVGLFDSPRARLGIMAGVVAAAAAAVLVVRSSGTGSDSGGDASDAKSAPWSGKIASLARTSTQPGDGVVQCDSSGSGCAPLGVSAEVKTGAMLRTDGRTRAQVRLADGSELVLDRDTEIVLDAKKDRTAKLTRGALVADVSHVKDGNAAFVVPGGKVEVLGTKLALYADKDRSRVEVTRGVVALSDESGAKEKVYAGEEGRVGGGRKISVTPSTTIADTVAWSERSFTTQKIAEASEEPLRGLGELRAKKPGTQEEKDSAVRLVKHDVKIRIADSVARTEIDETFENSTGEELEGIFRFPLPPDAQIERLALEVNGKLEEGAFVEKDKAAAIWRGVIQNAAPKAPKPVEEIIWVPGPWRDPALLEWKRGGRFELRIFPIPARGSRRVILAYTQTVQPVGGVRRYTYPLPYDAKGSTTLASFRLDAQVVGNDKAYGVRSRGYDVTAKGDGVEMQQTAFAPSGDLTLEYALPNAASEVSAYAYQPPSGDDGGAYALIQLRPRLPKVHDEGARDQVIVVDTSRSMMGERMAKARALVSSLVREMDPRDRVSVMACDTTCRDWTLGLADAGPRAGDAADKFLGGVMPDGAADLSAMVRLARDAASRGGRDKSRKLHVVYVGDGGASAGPTKPDHLTAEIRRAMPAGEGTVTAIAIGADADTTLLSAMARGGGGVVVPFVPGQRASVTAIAALSAINGITLQQPELTLPAGFVAVAPANLDSIRAGSETLVVARMSAREIEGEATLKGKVGGEAFEQKYPIKVLATSDAGNAFVPRQYAALRIADLERASGADTKTAIVDLSKRFSVASRHTSLLVLESEAMMTAFGLKRASAAPAWTGEQAATGSVADGTVEVRGAADEERERGEAPGGAGLGLSGIGSGGGGKAVAQTRSADLDFGGAGAAAPAAKPAAPMKDSRAGGDGFAQPPAGAPAAEAAPPRPAPTTAAGPRMRDDVLDVPMDKSEKKKADVAAGRRAPPSMPPPRPIGRPMIPMRKVWDRKGNVFTETGTFHDRDAAKIVAAESAIATKPDSRGATKDLFGLYALHGRLDRAAEIADRWASRDAMDPEALVARADMAARTGDRDLAIRILGGVVDVRPDDANAQNRLATLHELAGQRGRGCAHRVTLAEQLAGDVAAQAAAVRCSRSEGMTELADRLLGDVATDKRTAVEAAMGREPTDPGVLVGDVRLEATWDADVDLDVALIDKAGNRLSWMGGGKAKVTAQGATRPRSEAVAFTNLGAGQYLLEVTRTTIGDSTPVRGSITVRAVGETRIVPFTMTGNRLELGRVEVFYTSRLVPVNGPF